MDLSPPILVPVVLECLSHVPNATHPIPCPSPLVQLPPASQLKGLDWCTNHLMSCKFRSFFFFTDSQSTLSVLSSAPSYLLPESLWNVCSLTSSLSNNTTLSFQWIPGHAGLPGNENAYLLAKTGASLPTDVIPCPLPQSLPKSVTPSTTIGDVTYPALSELPSPRSLFGGTASFSPYLL